MVRHSWKTEYLDPYDRIYSILRIVDNALDIRPDYAASVRSVYQDVVPRAPAHCENLEMLRCCEMQERKNQLSSWVPDWETPILCKRPLGNLRAASDAKAQASLGGDGVLEVKAIYCATVSAVNYGACESAGNYFQSTLNVIWGTEPENVGEIPHLDGGTLLQAYMRIL